MNLIADAENAEDIAEALSKFKAAVSDHATDITASISELYGIGSALRDIDTALRSLEYNRNAWLIDEHLEFVRSSLHDTLENIFRILGDLGNGSRVWTDAMYRQTWKEISWFFRQRKQTSLRVCLEKYKRFILELVNIVKRREQKTLLVGELRDDIQALVPPPDRLTEFLNASLTKPRSYERDRPLESPPLRTVPRDIRPPSVPEVPASPSTATHMTSQSSSTDVESEHWATQVFRDTSTTPLTQTGDTSRCYGKSTPEARVHLKEQYKDIFSISFGGQSELSVRIYYRERDHRVRILCKWPRGSGRGSTYSCLPLDILEFNRVESSLQICKKRPGSSKLDLWANLNFSTIERLVIFYCTLLSLRAHDIAKPITHIHDHELAGENVAFAGQIIDDNYLHALRVYRDSDSKAVRLHASVLTGEMKRTPVWTAFITHYLVSQTWLRRASDTIIYLRELRPHVFSSEYSPQVTARGEHVLKFMSEEDADEFEDSIADLADRYARPPPTPPILPLQHPLQPHPLQPHPLQPHPQQHHPLQPHPQQHHPQQPHPQQPHPQHHHPQHHHPQHHPAQQQQHPLPPPPPPGPPQFPFRPR